MPFEDLLMKLRRLRPIWRSARIGIEARPIITFGATSRGWTEQKALPLLSYECPFAR
jgi:hypothetical protein